MQVTIPSAATGELGAAFFQAAITVGLAGLCGYLFRRYRKPYLAYWSLAWVLYTLRLAAIIVFLITASRHWLYWHQVTTGWTALALLWAALVFSQQLRWRNVHLALMVFPPVWAYIAIYRLDHFLLAALPAVLFLSAATLWMAYAFFRFHRQVRSAAAAFLAGALFLWGLHHLDYPFLRARGVWNPWGYYIDIVFVLAMGLGILLLVEEDLQRGLRALSALSGDLQPGGRAGDLLDALLHRPLTLPAVRGSALYLCDDGRYVRGAADCVAWGGRPPTGAERIAVDRALESGEPGIVRRVPGDVSDRTLASHAYIAALPILQHERVAGALVVVGDARDPFAALDTPFLVALGQQVGAALENADLYRRLRSRTEELERLAARMVRQHEDERRRLSRELHDETAQVLAAVSMQLGLLRERADAATAPRLDRALELVDEGIRGIRGVTEGLRPSLLDDLGLLPALRALVDDFRATHGIAAAFSAPERLPELSGDAELALFRALQEALSNVARHAGATRVGIAIHAARGSLHLAVIDDGRGPGANGALADAKMGLSGMRERLAALGGQQSFDRGPLGGARLVVSVPITPSRDEA